MNGPAPEPCALSARLPRIDDRDAAIVRLIERLNAAGYHFVTTTPATHERILARRSAATARGDHDVFGWSMAFDADMLSSGHLSLLRTAKALETVGDRLRSLVRVSSVCGINLAHSAFPTSDTQAVFLGPDSYRFCALITAELARLPAPKDARIVDIGIGAGVGALTAARIARPAYLLGTDINVSALRFAAINAIAAGVRLDIVETAGLRGIDGPFDLALLNPPFIMDDEERAYRHGGGMHGGQLSLNLAQEALGKLAPGGRLILYTGSAIVDGQDKLGIALRQAAEDGGCTLAYREIDPDIFGEELEKPAYAEVDRIAAVAAIFTKGPAPR